MSIMSRYMVKPAAATFTGIMPLSPLDQVFEITHASHLYFYKRPIEEDWLDSSENKIITTLTESLSQVLVEFYPLAGRLRWIRSGRLELDCNAMGAEVVEVESDKEIGDFGDFYSCGSIFLELLPDMKYIERNMEDIPVLAVQVTKFRCGGLCIGISISHVLGDGTSAFNFTREWARLALGQPIKVQPFLDRGALGAQNADDSPFLECDEYDDDYNYIEKLRLSQVDNWSAQIAPIFVPLSKDEIEKLKKIGNEKNEGRPYSRFEVVAAHVWRSVCMARELDCDETTSLTTVVDGRGRMDIDVLPLSYFGNAIVDVEISTTAGELLSSPLSYACDKIRESIQKVTTNYILDNINFFKELPTLSKYQYIHDRGMLEGPGCGDRNVLVVSWLNLPGRGIDFGWGKEVHFGMPVGHNCDGFFYISPYKDDGSVVVGVCLHPKEKFMEFMSVFEG